LVIKWELDETKLHFLKKTGLLGGVNAFGAENESSENTEGGDSGGAV
jgi:hypothetical protein